MGDKIFEGQYQDIRVNGKTISKGRRDCENRYKAIRPFLERFRNKDKFTVLDYGANYGYFSWRIKEDFPNAVITMVDNRDVLKLLFEINETKDMNLISENMTIYSIKEKLTEKYDLVILMSIIHHFPEPEDVIDYFNCLGEYILYEIDYPDIPNFTNTQKRVYDHLMTKNPIQINNWINHDRPIYYVNKNEIGLSGMVISGGGLASKYSFGYNRIFDWFGFNVVPGTLNILLERSIYFDDDLIVNGFKMIEMFINGLPVLAIEGTNHPTNPLRLELISRFNLREYFNLKDEQTVNISFKYDLVELYD